MGAQTLAEFFEDQRGATYAQNPWGDASHIQGIDRHSKNQFFEGNQNVAIGYQAGVFENNKKKEGIMNSFRAYLDKHRDLIFTVALVFLVDHYFLGGAFKERLQKLLGGVLDKAESNFHKQVSS